jgi:hypothetical protein
MCLDRPTALMSEPSYYGVFAALFGMPLMMMEHYNKYSYRILGLLIIISAFVINAKTMFIVMFFQVIFFWYQTKRKIISFKLMLGLLVFVIAAISMTLTQKPFDVEGNMSSAMRLGSSILALNLAADGYGLLGVGIGQFHFHYKEEFAPNFLLFSNEAQNQFELNSDGRASTFNQFIRFLIETGLIGFLIYLDVIRRAFKRLWLRKDSISQFSLLLLSGSIGFLMTQDTYFYPPMLLSLALAFSNKEPCTKAEKK